MPTVEAVTREGEQGGRGFYRVILSSRDPDWNGHWRGIYIWGDPECSIKPGDVLWYGGSHAYWTPNDLTTIVDYPFDRKGYDFICWRAHRGSA